MPRPIRRINDLLNELERHRKNSFIKVKTQDGHQYIIKRVKRIGSIVQILI